MAMHDYVVQEVGHDFAEGILSRREALRRLALLGLTVTGASAVLAACANDHDKKAASTTTAQDASAPRFATDDPPGSVGALRAEAITLAGPAGTLQGALAVAPNPKGAV